MRISVAALTNAASVETRLAASHRATSQRFTSCLDTGYPGGTMNRIFSHALIFLCCALFASGQSKPAADLIIHNARVWTVDSSRPEGEAVAVLGDRIVAVGSNQDLDSWRGPNTRVVDAEGKRLLPGFNDAHVHFVDGGSQLDNVELNDATSAREFALRIGERAAKMPKGQWLLGGDWDETKWNPAELPTKDLIDSLTPNIPVAVNRYGTHYVITVSAVNAQNGDVLARQEIEAENKEQVLKSLDKAASQLREKLGESIGSVQKFATPLEQATTSSIEA